MSAELADAERCARELAEVDRRDMSRGAVPGMGIARLCAVLLAEYDRRGAEIERLRVQCEAALRVCGTWDGVVGDGGIVAEEVRKALAGVFA